jgi:hypothetical protein
MTRERIVEAISAWFSGAQSGWRPKLLNNEAADSAVARGAAYYGRVRRGTGLRIRAGSARTYYIGLRSDDGLLHSVVTAEIAGEWVKALLNLSTFTAVTGSAIVLIARRTDDRSRDIDNGIREQAISRLMAIGIAEETIQLLSKYVPPERADAVRSFGESLPPGLQVVSSSNCLLSVPALHSSGPTFSKLE